MKGFLISSARWILVIPAFLLVWSGFNMCVGWLWRLLGLHFIAEIVGSPAPGFGVYFGAMVAPFWRVPVSVVLALLITLICGYGIVDADGPNRYQIPHLLYACILIVGIVAAWVAVGFVKNEPITHDAQ